ncbi:MAG TPA: ubiquitin-conjugating enzyme E2 [Planctomycetota bacterium]|nr:ubiquitin-conjugating enzyme E2 [Planctomycetota bacterium]
MPFFDTPRVRRLKADAEAMRILKENSTILEYQAHGDPPERYLVTLKGKGLHRKSETDPVEVAEVHRVEIRLGIDYPRSRPDLQWLTSIYHPNISAVGAVCLGGYSTNWVPSLGLAELCEMLWDMVRYANYDPKSAYNYAAGRWSETQTQYDLPLDARNLRDRMTKTVGDNIIRFDSAKAGPASPAKEAPPIVKPPEEDILIITDETAPPARMAAPFRPQPRPRPDDDVLIIE